MGKCKFSIIVPVYNNESHLDTCIQALLNQDYPKDKYEIIFVNNNSADMSCPIVQKYPAIKLLHEKEQNPFAARNTGILAARASYIALTDADTEVPHNWLTNISCAVNQHDYDLLIGWYRPMCHSRILQQHNDAVIGRIKKAIKTKQACMLLGCTANLVVKKTLFDKEGLFYLNSNSEDTYFAIRCLRKGYRVGFADNICVKRHDIPSLNVFLLKNFIYGCCNADDIKEPLLLRYFVEYTATIIKSMLRSFSGGFRLILASLPYCIGFCLARFHILNRQRISRILHHYVNLSNRIAKTSR